MALLNGLYIFVQDEKVSHNITSVTHPVEEGIDLTDHVLVEAQEISISGKIVGAMAGIKVESIVQMQRKGTMVVYIGRNFASNYQIIDFSTSHPNSVSGGCDFDMKLREVRIAKSPYNETNTAGLNVTAIKSITKTGMQHREVNSVVNAVYHTVKKGETLYGIAKSYNSLGATVKNLMEKNEDAPKVAGDWTTLQIGTKLLISDR